MVTAALAAVGAGLAAVFGPLFFLVVAGLTSLALVAAEQTLLIPLVIIASSIDRVSISAIGVQVRIDILVAVLGAALVVNRLGVRTMTISSLRSPITWPLLGYVGANVLSTVLFAQERTRGLQLDVEIVAAALAFVVMIGYLATRGDIERAMRALWWVTVAEAAIGVVFILLEFAHLSSFGVQSGDNGLPMAYGTQFEANIFGSFLLGNFFILLADYIRGRRTPRHFFGLFLILAGIVFSETRTVWLALALGLALFFALLFRTRRSSRAFIPILAAIPVLSLGGFLVGAATPFAGRLLDLVNLQSSSASGRLAIFRAALSDWGQNPIFGMGTGSFNIGAAPGQPHPWLPNLTVLTLHDTGLIGLAALVALVIAFYRHTWRALSQDRDLSLLVAGSMAGFAALLFAFQSTSGFWFAYPWIVVAVGLAATRIITEAPT